MQAHVLRVFTDQDGHGGNPLGVLLDTASLTDEQRQAIAAELAFSETVFVDDIGLAGLRIFTPAQELPLAGHPLVGTAWLLSQFAGASIDTLRPKLAAPVACWLEDGLTWIRARVDDAPPWQFVELATPSEIDALDAPPRQPLDQHEVWAWQDREAGVLRARCFAGAFGVPEDEATGSAALRLTTLLQRPITIRQGKGSVILARPAAEAGWAEIGGHVVSDGTHEVPAQPNKLDRPTRGSRA